MKTIKINAIVILLIYNIASHAQTSENNDLNILQSKSNGISTSSKTTTPDFSVEFESNTDADKVSIKKSLKLNGGITPSGHNTTTYYIVGLEGALNKKDDFSDIATLDGLSNSSNVSFGIKWVRIGGFKSPEKLVNECNLEELDRQITNFCITKANEYLEPERKKQIEHCKSGDFVIEGPELKTLQQKNAKRIESGESPVANMFARCSPMLPEKGNNDDNPADIHFWGMQLKYGQEKFNYMNLNDFSKEGDTVAPRSLGLYYGYIWPGYKESILFGIDYQKSYKAADEQTFCRENSDLNLYECNTSSFMAPTKKTNKLVFLEYRSNFKKYAIEPRITIDIESDTIGFNLPIMLWKDKNKRFNSGIRFGYRDDTEEISFGVFVGTPFNHYATD
jgi:hypothetical protein